MKLCHQGQAKDVVLMRRRNWLGTITKKLFINWSACLHVNSCPYIARRIQKSPVIHRQELLATFNVAPLWKIYSDLWTSKSVRWFWNSVLIRIHWTRSIKLTTTRVLDKRTKYFPKKNAKLPVWWSKSDDFFYWLRTVCICLTSEQV